MRRRPTSRPTRVDLDDPRSYQRLDPRGMLDLAVDFPAQAEHAVRIGEDLSPPDSLRDPAHIVLGGMGGSAVVGDFLARLSDEFLPIPFLVCRDYRLPRLVGPDTLFIASSHSGNTEETLAATALALRRRARVVCITTGGKLRSLALRRRLPLIELPEGDPPMPPRAALGYSLLPLVVMLGTLGLYPGAGRQIRESLRLLPQLRREVGPDVPGRRNRAKRLALDLQGKLPWVHGTAGIMSAVAYRWRCQFNENSKVLAASAGYPELNHNEVVGWDLSPELARHIAVVDLRRPAEPARMEARLTLTRRMIGRRAPVRVIEAHGRSPLAQLLWTCYLGDLTSIYLAFLNGADPAAIPAISELKERLALL